jgi:hypothetical protein
MENGRSIVESSFTEPLHKNGHGADAQNISYVIASSVELMVAEQ